MSFLAYPFSQLKKPFAEVLPDGRKRLTRFFQVTATNLIPQGLDDAPGTLDDWPQDQTPTGWTGLRLTYKKFEDSTADKGADTRPILQLIFEEIPENDRVMEGDPAVSVNQYGFTEVVITYVQFSGGSTSYAAVDIVGTATAPSPYTTAILKTVEGTNDGTLRRYILTYTTGGEMSDIEELRFGGKISIRTLRYLNSVPPTPSGYTLVGPGIEYVLGLPLYTYQFARASNGSGGGTGGEISQGFVNTQNGTDAFLPSSPNTSTGAVVCTTRYVTTPAVTSNPVTQPTGFVLFAVEVEDEAGYRLWTTRSGFGDGLVLDESTISASGALVIYHRIEFGAAPATPTQTIGGTVTLFESSEKNDQGYVIFDYRWAEGSGQASISTDGEPDGALVYTVTDYAATATTPTYPGSGTAYLIRLTQKPESGYFVNTAVYKKPPATDTYEKTMGFEEPGIAEFVGSPPQFTLRPPKQRTLVADVQVSYSTAQLSVTVFDVEAYASFTEAYTPTDTGVAVQTQRGLGGYLAQASGISGTNSDYNGVLCDEWEAELISSVPSTFPTGATTLKVDNEPYLTDITGVKIYRRTQVTYSF
jgi:hypothetical protein